MVAHGAAENEESGFEAEEGSDIGFEGICRGVFTEDVVKKRGLEDGAEHRGGSGGGSVAWRSV